MEATSARTVLPRNFWYVAVPSSRLGRKPVACSLLRHDLVLFRDRNANPRALLDRCCHRGVRLSLGTVVDGTLRCRYHGWRFQGNGGCVEIPSLPGGAPIKANVSVPAFPCIERDGYVWVWIGAGPPQPEMPPTIANFGRHRWIQGTMLFACSFVSAIENSLDWCHAAFAHPWTHPHWFASKLHGMRNQPYEYRVTERGLVVFAPITKDAAADVPAKALKIDFALPDRIVFSVGSDDPLIILRFVPINPAACRLEWLARRTLPIGPRIRWSDRTPTVFAQDRKVLESAQEWYDCGDEHLERSVEADAASLLVRRIIALAAEGRWELSRGRLHQRRIVSTRA
jgi:phenylpropionate dioxygenase-like ring-hydroxylating dioxygenase large terminal subunit